MKRTTAKTILLAGVLAAVWAWPGCDDMRTSPRPEAMPVSHEVDAGPLAGADANAPAQSRSDESTKYTILLATYTGPNHAANARRAKGIAGGPFVPATDLLVVHKENGSDLYWNRTYRSAEDAYNDLMKARSFRVAGEQQPAFLGAITVAMMPAAYGPREWNLMTATWQYEWTVLVGEYEDSPQDGYVGRRIKDCVAHVRELRDKGFKAYYYHGPAKSLVTVGMFFDSAVQQAVIRYETNRSGQKIPVLGQKIVDPEIEKIMKTKEPPLYCLAWNGHMQRPITVDRTGKKVKGPPIGSRLLSIPRSASEGRKVLEERLRASRAQRQRDIDSLAEPGQVPGNP